MSPASQSQPAAVAFYVAQQCSESKVSSHLYADMISDQIVGIAQACKGRPIWLRGYSPPLEGAGVDPHGYLELCLFPEEDREWPIGIFFGMAEPAGDFLRSDFDVAAWSKSKDDPSASNLYVASFDEAWRVVCLAAKKLRAPSVTIAYGF